MESKTVDAAIMQAIWSTPGVSWEAKAVWLYGLAGNDTRQETLVQLGNAGREKVQRIMRELIACHAAEFTRTKRDDGRFLSGTCYVFYPPTDGSTAHQ
jgi:hypothetical protein